MIAEFLSSPAGGVVLFTALFAVIGFFGVVVLKKNRHVSQLPDEDFPKDYSEQEADVVEMALCKTRAGRKTHYRKLGKAKLHTRVKGKPTLCGAEAHNDLQDQDAEATCVTCREALSKFGYPFI